MAVVNTKTTQITNANSSVQTLNNQALTQARVYVAVATVAVASGDDDGSVYRMIRVHSSWRILSAQYLGDAFTAGTVWHLGLYQTAANGGAVVAVSAYASSVDLSAAKVAWLELGYEARAITLVGQQVWQDAGLTADSDRWYDLCLTGATVGSASGNIALMVQFTTGGS